MLSGTINNFRMINNFGELTNTRKMLKNIFFKRLLCPFNLLIKKVRQKDVVQRKVKSYIKANTSGNKDAIIK